APRGPNEAVIDFETAKSFGFRIGDPLTVQFNTGAATFSIVGIGGLGEHGDKSSGGRLISIQLSRLQQLTDQVGKANWISVAAASGVSQTTLRTTLQRLEPPHVQVLTGRQFVAETQKQIQQLLNVVTNLVSAFGFIAAF